MHPAALAAAELAGVAALGGSGAGAAVPKRSLSSLQSLARDLSEAEAQYTHALCSHLHNIDQLLQLQRCRLGYLDEDYNTELEALKKEFETERYRGRGKDCLLWGRTQAGK